ncbi:MAG: DUF2735 domain-containing protein [Methyloceanibacter sp.]|uniref:DUF2735 domain-containing protein n=1 Tax=Methyloceanibacter sp. TaxID=1965321 RepID=UPI003D6D73AE
MTDTNRQSATIYQFPAGGRVRLGGRRDMAAPAEQFVAPRAVKAVLGGAWYHDEAIEEANRVRKN